MPPSVIRPGCAQLLGSAASEPPRADPELRGSRLEGKVTQITHNGQIHVEVFMASKRPGRTPQWHPTTRSLSGFGATLAAGHSEDPWIRGEQSGVKPLARDGGSNASLACSQTFTYTQTHFTPRIPSKTPIAHVKNMEEQRLASRLKTLTSQHTNHLGSGPQQRHANRKKAKIPFRC